MGDAPNKNNNDKADDKETALHKPLATSSQGGSAPPYGRVARIDWSQPSGNRSMAISTTVIVGSASTVDVIVEGDPAVSRIHAEIEPREDGVWIRDLGSKNGTYVQGVRVESARIPHLGRVKLGSIDLVVTYGGGSAATSPHAPKKAEPWPHDHFGPLVGGSRAMRELFARLAKVSSGDASVLVTGESGTGKELVARAIHERSERAKGPLVIVDCAALAETLLDSELFGHAKGAFTGASSARAGAIESADGGTVFLDEIGELPRSMQPKLLRVLEAKTVRRIGETNHRKVDVRIISATHRDLLRMVNAGDFREDLYFRLAVLPVRVPPLRERTDDIPVLARHFLGPGGSGGHDDDVITTELITEMATRSWRGNVRELRNFVERVKTLGAAEALSTSSMEQRSQDSSEDVPAPTSSQATMKSASDPEPAAGEGADAPAPRFEQPYRLFRDAWHEYGESAYVTKLLARNDQNVAQAATEAEIDRTYLYKMIRKYTR